MRVTSFGTALLMLMFFITACSTSRKLPAAGTKKADVAPSAKIITADYVAAKADSASLLEKYLSARLTATITRGADDKNEVTISWRCVRDSAIWMSFSMLGIEGARLLLTPDSIKFMDRLHSTYYKGNYSFVYNKISLNVQFKQIQALLLASPLPYSSPIFLLGSEVDSLVYNIVTQTASSDKNNPKSTSNLSQQLFINKTSFKIEKNIASDSLSKRNFTARYTDWKPLGKTSFPHQSDWQISGPSETTVKLVYSKVNVETSVNMPFSIPARYEAIH